jgi:hypothetical protein
MKDYLDPRWQKFRLDRLQASNWKCDACDDGSSTLHVHHRFYISGRKPWEYDPETLFVLCKECHEIAHEFSSNSDSLGFDKWERVIGEIMLAAKAYGPSIYEDVSEFLRRMEQPR